MRGELIRILSSVEEKANELKLDGFEPDVVLFAVSEISGLSIRVVDEFGKDAVIVDSKVLGLGLGGAKRLKVIKD